MCERAGQTQPNGTESPAANERRGINIFSLTTSNKLSANQPVGGAWRRFGWVFLSPARIVCASGSCDAVIRRPGRIWGVWESHERNDAILGNQFLAGDNTSRTRTCFIK